MREFGSLTLDQKDVQGTSPRLAQPPQPHPIPLLLLYKALTAITLQRIETMSTFHRSLSAWYPGARDLPQFKESRLQPQRGYFRGVQRCLVLLGPSEDALDIRSSLLASFMHG